MSVLSRSGLIDITLSDAGVRASRAEEKPNCMRIRPWLQAVGLFRALGHHDKIRCYNSHVLALGRDLVCLWHLAVEISLPIATSAGCVGPDDRVR